MKSRKMTHAEFKKYLTNSRIKKDHIFGISIQSITITLDSLDLEGKINKKKDSIEIFGSDGFAPLLTLIFEKKAQIDDIIGLGQ